MKLQILASVVAAIFDAPKRVDTGRELVGALSQQSSRSHARGIFRKRGSQTHQTRDQKRGIVRSSIDPQPEGRMAINIGRSEFIVTFGDLVAVWPIRGVRTPERMQRIGGSYGRNQCF
jgi:hypothetical protein